MRKVLSFVLVLSLVLGSFGMAFAAPLSDMAGEKSEEAVTVLTELGVVSGYPDGSYKPGNIVTRAEMAVIVVRALGLADYAIGTANFSDMGGHWSNPYVAYAASLGVIAGYPDGTFRPDKTVSYDEAATMLVAALGYTPDSLQGTWPANYVVKAKSLGILDGIKAGAAGANRGDIAIMAYQTLDALIGSTDKDGKWTANEPDDTMLDRLGAKLYEDPDQFDPEAKTLNYAFVVDGDEDSIINLRPYLGAYVVAYANNDGDIIAIKEVKSVYLTGEYDAEDSVFETDDVDYNVTSDLLSIAHPNNVAFVNGDLVGYYDEEGDFVKDSSMDIEDLDALVLGEITVAAKVSGKRITEIYSLAAWEVTEADLFDEDLLDEETLLGEDFALDDNDEIDLQSFELIGVDSLDDIDEDNVVYVYVGPDSDEIAKVAVGTEVVEGKVTKSNADGTTVTIASKSYDVAGVEGAVDKIDLGDTGTAYLDFEGNIFAWDLEDKLAGNYALVIAAAEGNDLDSDRVRLLLADGTKKIFDVDSKAYATSVDIDDFVEGDLVTYSVNKDGEIDKISEKTLDDPALTGKLSKSGAVFAGKQVDSAVVVFEKDGNSPEGVVKLADVTRDSTTLGTYSPDGKIEVLIVAEDDIDGAEDTVFAVINKVELAIDDDDDDVHFVTGFADGVAFTAYTDSQSYFEDYDAVDDGPGLWELELNADGVIVDAAFYNTTDITESSIEDWDFEGAVQSRDGNLVKIDGEWYTLDSSAVFYAFDYDKTSNPYSLKKLADAKSGTYPVLVQLDEDSEYYDLVLLLSNFPLS